MRLPGRHKLRAVTDARDRTHEDLPRGTHRETVTLHAFRRGVLMTFEATLKSPPDTVVYLELLEDADEAALARRQAWLGVCASWMRSSTTFCTPAHRPRLGAGTGQRSVLIWCWEKKPQISWAEPAPS